MNATRLFLFIYPPYHNRYVFVDTSPPISRFRARVCRSNTVPSSMPREAHRSLPPTAVLHIHGNGYLRVVHRGESHKHGMVVSTVLCRTRLAADFYAGNVGFTASPANTALRIPAPPFRNAGLPPSCTSAGCKACLSARLVFVSPRAA